MSREGDLGIKGTLVVLILLACLIGLMLGLRWWVLNAMPSWCAFPITGALLVVALSMFWPKKPGEPPEIERVPVGSFECRSGRIEFGDRGAPNDGAVDGVPLGDIAVELVVHRWARAAMTESIELRTGELTNETSFASAGTIDVDTGIALFFDANQLSGEDAVIAMERRGLDEMYARETCPAALLTDGAGRCIGVLCSSGRGDGSYTVEVARDESGAARLLRCRFL